MLSIKPVIEVRRGRGRGGVEAADPEAVVRYLAEKGDQASAAGRVEALGVMNGDAADIDGFIEMVCPSAPADGMLVGLIGAGHRKPRGARGSRRRGEPEPGTEA